MSVASSERADSVSRRSGERLCLRRHGSWGERTSEFLNSIDVVLGRGPAVAFSSGARAHLTALDGAEEKASSSVCSTSSSSSSSDSSSS